MAEQTLSKFFLIKGCIASFRVCTDAQVAKYCINISYIVLFFWWVEVNDILSISICERIHKLRLIVILISQLETDYFISPVLSVSLHLPVSRYLSLCFSLCFRLSLCLFVCLSLSLFLSFVCLSVCLSSLSICLSVCLSHPLYFTLSFACSSFFPCSFSSWLSHTYRHTCEHTHTHMHIHTHTFSTLKFSRRFCGDVGGNCYRACGWTCNRSRRVQSRRNYQKEELS